MLLNREQRMRRLQGRLVFLYPFVALLLLILGGRLYYLQIYRWKDFRKLSRDNLLVTQKLPGARGMIFDRNGRLLVSNRAAFNICVRPNHFWPARTSLKKAALEKTARLLGSVIDQEPGEIIDKIKAVRGRRRFQPLSLKRDLSWKELSMLTERWVEGLEIEPEPIRSYPEGDLAAHILGYMGEIAEHQLIEYDREHPELHYSSGDLVGQFGLEKRWEFELRGKMGYKQKIVDARGAELSEDWIKVLGYPLSYKSPEPGDDLVLTLDLDLQRAAEEALGGEAGAVIALDPWTGEVLALVSHPSFDPAAFARGVTRKELNALYKDPKEPLFNRAIQGKFVPGSTFKIVTAAAGLEDKVITPKDTQFCRGAIKYGRHTFRCWRRGGHGELAVKDAIKQSCDVFFYKLGEALGIERLAHYARLFGLGAPTGIDIGGENPGVVPDPEWKEKTLGKKWVGGETIIAAIGQGYVELTPLQVAVMTAVVANGGYVVRPRLMREVKDHQGEIVKAFEAGTPRGPVISPETAKLIQEAMVAVVNGGGTGGRARIRGFQVAGKTGTAQVVKLDAFEHMDQDEIPWRYRDHAWFTSFAPADRPTIVVTVLLQHGGKAGHGAIARKVLLKWAQLTGHDV